MNEGMHLKEIVKHKRAHKKDVEKLKSEFLQQIDECKLNNFVFMDCLSIYS